MCSTLSEHLHTDTGVCGKGWEKEGGGGGKRRKGGRKEGEEMEKGRRWEKQRNSMSRLKTTHHCSTLSMLQAVDQRTCTR